MSEDVNYINLPDKFVGKGEVKGFEFTKVKSNDVGCIYRVDAGDVSYYEVFKNKYTPVCIDFKNRVYSETEMKQVYPKAKHFGVWAWTTFKLDKANKYLQA